MHLDKMLNIKGYLPCNSLHFLFFAFFFNQRVLQRSKKIIGGQRNVDPFIFLQKIFSYFFCLLALDFRFSKKFYISVCFAFGLIIRILILRVDFQVFQRFLQILWIPLVINETTFFFTFVEIKLFFWLTHWWKILVYPKGWIQFRGTSCTSLMKRNMFNFLTFTWERFLFNSKLWLIMHFWPIIIVS